METNGKIEIAVEVNGRGESIEVDPRRLLVEVIREDLGLTGTHVGCLTGDCGACTVVLNGEVVKSCSVLAVGADGSTILTIEGLACDGELDPVQQAFWDQYGFQCGFCLPGMVLCARELLRQTPRPTVEEIHRAIDGNLCRCTGYQNITRAIAAAAEDMAGEGPG
jgi:aerobic-type carbon monoxide dehydrogenase small subunit (CoxS/CutS family)